MARKLVTLPRIPTVVEILQEFQDYVMGLGKSTKSAPLFIMPNVPLTHVLFFFQPSRT